MDRKGSREFLARGISLDGCNWGGKEKVLAS